MFGKYCTALFHCSYMCTSNAYSLYRPYSEQHHDRYESEAVRGRLTVFPMASAVKS